MLTGVAGFVDGVGYLVLGRVFVANMSGNSVAIGLSAAEWSWRGVVHRGYPVLMFLAGLLIGGVLAERARRRAGVKLAPILLLEAILLAAFLICAAFMLGLHGSPREPAALAELVLVALTAAAMGVQNVSLRASGALSVYTTHVTGSLTQLADEAIRYAYWVRDRTASRTATPAVARWRRVLRASPRHPSFSELCFLTACWCVYVAGAAAGALGLIHWGLIAMAGPPVVLALLAAAEWTAEPFAVLRINQRSSSDENQQ
jgi:uncharacterized membrane protein YoaK (UPF0700 family)